MGEFGGNDYIFLLAANKTVEQTKAYVPTVVNAIALGVEVLPPVLEIEAAHIYVHQASLNWLPFRHQAGTHTVQHHRSNDLDQNA
jgi:hypothetical protein